MNNSGIVLCHPHKYMAQSIAIALELSDHIYIDSVSKIHTLSLSSVVGIFWIEDILTTYSSISDFVIRLRIGNESKPHLQKMPIIILGFRSLDSVLLAERYPKLLFSRGVNYLKLPADIKEIIATFEKVKSIDIKDPVQVVRPFIQNSDEVSKEQSKMIHTLGNFFGSEKLLYGAYIEKHIRYDQLMNIINDTRAIQRNYCTKEDILDYEVHLLRQPDFNSIQILPATLSGQSINGRVLLIDDLAHMGWARAIAELLCAGQALHITNNKQKDGLNINQFESADKLSYLESLSADLSSQTDEGVFLDDLLKKLSEKYVSNFDFILLDLRLKRKADEVLPDPTFASGTKVIENIRKFNAGIPIIILTASRMARNMDKVFHLGADGYFLKEMAIVNDADASDYFKRFIELSTFALSKAYLNPAWRIIRNIETNLGATTEEVDFLKKAIALIKKRPYSYEKNVMKFDTVCDSLIMLGNVRESRTKRELYNTLDCGNLIQGLRSFIAHPGTETLSEFDVKIGLYLTFRLYLTASNELKEYVSKAFPSIVKKDLNLILLKSYAKLAMLIKKTYLEAIMLTRDDLYPDIKTGNYFAQHCKVTAFNASVKNNYLYFLCFLPLNQYNRKYMKPQDFSKPDKTVLNAILNYIDNGFSELSTSFSGILMKIASVEQYSLNTPIIGIEKPDIELTDDVKKCFPLGMQSAPIEFDLVRTSRNSFRAVNIKIVL